MTENAWSSQSDSLVEVQKVGGNLEAKVKEVLGWSGGRVRYDLTRNYLLQVDAVYPNERSPLAILSATYTNPDTKGHSNENKLQLKIGELALLKYAYPEIRVILAIGGSREAWLDYVLEVFGQFYDEVLFLWEENGRNRLREIGNNYQIVKQKHLGFWNDMRSEWSNVILMDDVSKIPNSIVRYQVLDALKNQDPIPSHPTGIENEIGRFCLKESYDRSGKEWDNYQNMKWNTIEMSRSYFNPLEAATEIVLRFGGFKYEGGVAVDVQVNSLLHDFGLTKTKVSEDFVLFSERYNMPVFIQCKASGGGRRQHGKNIQNRTKEQIARRIFYSSRYLQHTLHWKAKDFIWIGIVDGNWGVSRKQPFKYIHMLQLAGYDHILGASSLLDANLDVIRDNNPLHMILTSLDCSMSE